MLIKLWGVWGWCQVAIVTHGSHTHSKHVAFAHQYHSNICTNKIVTQWELSSWHCAVISGLSDEFWSQIQSTLCTVDCFYYRVHWRTEYWYVFGLGRHQFMEHSARSSVGKAIGWLLMYASVSLSRLLELLINLFSSSYAFWIVLPTFANLGVGFEIVEICCQIYKTSLLLDSLLAVETMWVIRVSHGQ